MGTLKLEVNIPEFDKEITIEVTLRKDGKVTCKGTQQSPSSAMPDFEELPPLTPQNPEQKKNLTKTSSKPALSKGGNMMNEDF